MLFLIFLFSFCPPRVQGLRSTSAHLWAPEKARVRQPLVILSPCLGDPQESPPAPASNLEFSPPTCPLHFYEEDSLSEPEGNIATSSSEPTIGESPAFPALNSEDVPPDGKPVKGNVKAPPQTPQSTSSSKPPTSDDARPYVFIRGKLVEVPEVYPKGTEGERPTIYSRAGRVACEVYP